MKKRTISGLAALVTASVIISGDAGAQQIAFSTGDLIFKGDFRYRHEQISAEGAKQQDRERIRARMNVTAVVAPKVNLVFGIASGSGDPVSSNETLTGGIADIPFSIDLAYFDYTTPVPGLKLQGGKMKNPFYTAAKSQLIWDSDLNPEGIAVQLSRRSGATELFANASYLWVQERSADKDALILGGQGGLKQAVGGLNMTVGAGFFDYTNTKGYDTFYKTNTAAGNTLSGVKYAYDYQMVEAFGEVSLSKAVIPVSFAVDYVANIASDVEENTGYLFGITAGKTTPGSFSGQVFYRRLEKDAVVGAYSDSDFGGGGTNNKGTVFSLSYQASKNISFGTTLFVNQKGVDSGTDYNRLQIDSNFKF